MILSLRPVRLSTCMVPSSWLTKEWMSCHPSVATPSMSTSSDRPMPLSATVRKISCTESLCRVMAMEGSLPMAQGHVHAGGAVDSYSRSKAELFQASFYRKSHPLLVFDHQDMHLLLLF